MKTSMWGRLSLLMGACLMASGSIAQEGDAERGEAASATCVACHQANGGGMNISGGESWPRLAGLNSNYIAKQLHDFKAGDRQNATMVTFANMLDDQQIADVAAYYSQLPATPGQGGDNADEALLARGEQLAERGDWNAYIVSCKSCHGPGGQGVGETFPGIAGQHAGYISAQLNAWKNDTRSNDPQNLMGAIAKRMSEEDIQAVSAWYATQPAAEWEATQ
ncbi:cytochrome c [Vreelandella lionensis]|uniref:c-type cytochrome n=1 Tax=Halomonadaceae TaxID=28256 RepID=UPI0009F40855|nr:MULTISPECIES: c-type cytochrome [Halomonas]MCP1316583.1 cytochrome c4 [Halomonas sp. 707B3]